MLTVLSFLIVSQATTYPIKVQGCHDGDSCTVALTIPVPGWGLDLVVQESTRFCNIDAPELKGATYEAAKVSRDYVVSRIKASTTVEWRTHVKGNRVQRDKYGRLLGWLMIDNVEINGELVAKGLATAHRVARKSGKLRKGSQRLRKGSGYRMSFEANTKTGNIRNVRIDEAK